MAVKCLQRNLRVLRAVATWSWWKLFCKVRPLLDVNMDNERVRAKEVQSYIRSVRSHCHFCSYVWIIMLTPEYKTDKNKYFQPNVIGMILYKQA